MLPPKITGANTSISLARIGVVGPDYVQNHLQSLQKKSSRKLNAATQKLIRKKKVGYHEFWKIANQIINRDKAIINGPEVISFSTV